jgi:superoxide dismutase, Fe-Mn family
MYSKKPYRTKEFNLSGLNGISDKTLQVHLGLYDGYVKNTNLVLEKLAGLIKNGSPNPDDFPAYSELKRALGFEYNGMVLHEYYFGNLKKDGGGEPARGSSFYKMAESSFGSYESWKAEFMATGRMRGVGWAVCYEDFDNGKLLNQWVTLHQTGNVAGYRPLLVMDVWEHAFLLDYKPAERPKYIEAFFSNIDWSAVEARLLSAKA